MVSFFGVRLGVKCEIWVIASLFFLLTIPLTPISRGMNCTGWPVSVMSWMSDCIFFGFVLSGLVKSLFPGACQFDDGDEGFS